jgi:hypothetical protein
MINGYMEENRVGQWIQRVRKIELGTDSEKDRLDTESEKDRVRYRE